MYLSIYTGEPERKEMNKHRYQIQRICLITYLKKTQVSLLNEKKRADILAFDKKLQHWNSLAVCAIDYPLD